MRKPRHDDRAIIEMLGDDQEFAVEFLHMVYGGLDEAEEERFLTRLRLLRRPYYRHTERGSESAGGQKNNN